MLREPRQRETADEGQADLMGRLVRVQNQFEVIHLSLCIIAISHYRVLGG
jgi:hypothetical protein